MKIGILTHPLGNNYGGLLQAYALQKTLKDMGHEPWIIRREMDVSIVKKFKRLIKQTLNLFRNTLKTDTSQIDRFKELIEPKTQQIFNNRQLRKKTSTMQFEAYIVGSDQVWRPRYIRPIANFFFDFIEQ